MTALPAIGHNEPPSELELLPERLKDETREIHATVTGLQARVELLPKTIDDERMAGTVSDLVKEIMTAAKQYEEKRKTIKEPYAKCAKAVDDFFRPTGFLLETLRARGLKVLDQYSRKKAQEEAERQAEIARLQREEAERQAAAAKKLEEAGLAEHAEVQMKSAIKAEAEAIKTESQTVAQLSTVRAANSMSGLRKRMVATITNKDELDLEKLRPYLKLDHLQVALNAYMASGGREIAGATIKEDYTTTVR